MSCDDLISNFHCTVVTEFEEDFGVCSLAFLQSQPRVGRFVGRAKSPLLEFGGRR